MALRNRSFYVEQPIQQPVESQPQKKIKVKKRKLITRQERFLHLCFLAIVAVMSVLILHKQGDIQTKIIEIQKVEAEISKVESQNVDYKVQISEKSTYERIMAIAKEKGLILNEDNVKVVPGE